MTIYFIRDQQNRVKIGVTKDRLPERLSSIQTCNADRLVVARTINDANGAAERWLHHHYADRHIGGEWFTWCETMLTIDPLQELFGGQILDTEQVADWLGVSVQFLEIGRSKGYGPSFVMLSARRIGYQRSAVRAWLKERTFACTSQYAERPAPKRREVAR